MTEPAGWEFVLDPPEDGGVLDDFWAQMAERQGTWMAWVWEHDRLVIRAWMAGSTLADRTELMGRHVEDVCTGL